MKTEPIYIYKKWFKCPECTTEFYVYMTQGEFNVAVPPCCPDCGMDMKAENIIPPLLHRIAAVPARIARASWVGSWILALESVMSFDVSRPFHWAWRGPKFCWEMVGWPIRKKPWGSYAWATRVLEEQERSMTLARKMRIMDVQLKEAQRDLNKKLAQLGPDVKVNSEEGVVDAEFMPTQPAEEIVVEVKLEFENINRERKIRMATPVERFAMLLHVNAENAFQQICPVCKIWWDTPGQAAICARSHAMGESK